MKPTAIALALVVGVLGAQDKAKPYKEGDVHGFLQQARSNQRPAVVLFNFNNDSG